MRELIDQIAAETGAGRATVARWLLGVPIRGAAGRAIAAAAAARGISQPAAPNIAAITSTPRPLA